MGPEGQLTIDLERTSEGAGRVTISSSRPLGITRTFTAQAAADAVQTIPLLFNVCGMAQAAAAAGAAERALGQATPAATQTVRQLLVLAETAREHLLSTQGLWPRFTGNTKDDASIMRIMRVCERLRATIDPQRRAHALGASIDADVPAITAAVAALDETIQELVLGEPASVFLSRASIGDFEQWRKTTGTVAARLAESISTHGWASAGNADSTALPELAALKIAARLLDDDAAQFIAAPDWEGSARETSSLKRQSGHPLIQALQAHHGTGVLTRLAARVIELASLSAGMTSLIEDATLCASSPGSISADAIGPGQGVAQVEAARGRLIHAVVVHDERVARYAILAPTEWNFHPEGAAARGLAAITAACANVKDCAELFITLIDPCVSYAVRVR